MAYITANGVVFGVNFLHYAFVVLFFGLPSSARRANQPTLAFLEVALWRQDSP